MLLFLEIKVLNLVELHLSEFVADVYKFLHARMVQHCELFISNPFET